MDSYQYNYGPQSSGSEESDEQFKKSDERMKEHPYNKCKNCMHYHHKKCNNPMMYQPMVSPYSNMPYSNESPMEKGKDPDLDPDPMYGVDPPMMYGDDPPMMYGHPQQFPRPYHRPFHHFHHHVHHHFFHHGRY
jgi:hypothetical protein